MSSFSRLDLALTLGALVLAACGENPTQPTTANQSSAAVLSPFGCGPGCWTIRAMAERQVWRYGLAAGVVDNAGQSTVYVLGGRFNQAPSDPAATTILAYDVHSDRWTTKAAHFTGATTNGVGTIGGRLYISGGAELAGAEWKPVSSKLFAYDVAADRVIKKADMPDATAEGVTGVINRQLYVLAGTCYQQPLCRSFYRYDPATNTWATLPSAPHSHVHGAGAVLGGKFYVAGGGSSPFRSFDVYDPVAGSWTSPGLLPPRRQFAAGAAVRGRFYVVGIEGADRAGATTADRNTVAYNPATNVWRNTNGYGGPNGEGGQFLLRPAAALRVLFDGEEYLLAVGSGHLFSDDTVKPAGTIDPGPPYIYVP
jgi:N-acetylneuraminic acid mutarotase